MSAPRTTGLLDRILVPLDGSSLSCGILGCVRELLLRATGEIVLLRVLVPEDDERAARDDLARLAEELGGAGSRARFALAHGDPAEQILIACERERPTLVAMATHGRSGLAHWLRGSVAERVLRNVRAPLLLVNPIACAATGTTDPERESVPLARELAFKKILAPLDGSEESARILPLVRDLARVYGSSVTLFHVAEPGCADARACAARWKPRLEEVPTEIETGTGDPARAIVDAADRTSADLIALATHGRGDLERWAFGSVAEDVVRAASRPLLVVRAPVRPGLV